MGREQGDGDRPARLRSACPWPGALGWMKLVVRLPLTSFGLGTVESVTEIDAGARPGGYPGLLP